MATTRPLPAASTSAAGRLRGRVSVDLTGVATERMKSRVAGALDRCPAGVLASVEVGPLRVEPACVLVIRRALQREVNVEVVGTPDAVRRWLTAIEDGMPGEDGGLW